MWVRSVAFVVCVLIGSQFAHAEEGDGVKIVRDRAGRIVETSMTAADGSTTYLAITRGSTFGTLEPDPAAEPHIMYFAAGTVMRSGEQLLKVTVTIDPEAGLLRIEAGPEEVSIDMLSDPFNMNPPIASTPIAGESSFPLPQWSIPSDLAEEVAPLVQPLSDEGSLFNPMAPPNGQDLPQPSIVRMPSGGKLACAGFGGMAAGGICALSGGAGCVLSGAVFAMAIEFCSEQYN
jgi:hypothetical protein